MSSKKLNRALKVGVEVVVIQGTAVSVESYDGLGLITKSYGSSVPSSIPGFAKGSLFVKTGVAAGTKALYENIGDDASCNFNLIGDIAASEITLAEGNLLVGNSSGVATALNAKTSNQILSGNGTTVVSQAVAGDLSKSGTTWTVANDAITDAKLADANVGQVRTATATADGLTTGTLTAGSQFVTVTCDDANKIIVLPAAVPGTRVVLINGGTGYELRSSSPTTISINGGTGADAESAIGASTVVYITCVSATAWVGYQQNTAGVLAAVEVAA